jgi:hypothetical protein
LNYFPPKNLNEQATQSSFGEEQVNRFVELCLFGKMMILAYDNESSG